MNLQQTYDLIGQILKERPELAGYPVNMNETFINSITVDKGLCEIFLLDETMPISETEETLWQHQ